MAERNLARKRPTESMSSQHIVTDTNVPPGALNEDDAVIPVDSRFEYKFGSVQNAYVEGFASAHGARPESAETDGAVLAPENLDSSFSTKRALTEIEQENSGLADN